MPNNTLVVEVEWADIIQKERIILSDLHLKISKGEFVYLIGKTGSGKSSLLKTLYGALPLTKGRANVCGFDMSNIGRKKIPLLRRQLGIVFQDFNLLEDRDIRENLLFVLKSTAWKDSAAIEKRIDEVLNDVQLIDKKNKMPYELSGGEQQRVVIARALLNRPQLILADEPTGNLDPETSDAILLLLRKLAKQHNTAILFATHDYRIIEQFPARLIRCIHGKIVNDEEVII